MNTHEFGHTIQYFGISAATGVLGDAWSSYLIWNGIGAAGDKYLGMHGMENGISNLGNWLVGK